MLKPNHPAESSAAVRDLLALTHSLVGTAEALQLDPTEALLRERGRILRRLVGRPPSVAAADRETLRAIAELGEQARLPLAVKRENLRNELTELRRKRQANQALKPYRENRGRRLNVKL